LPGGGRLFVGKRELTVDHSCLQDDTLIGKELSNGGEGRGISLVSDSVFHSHGRKLPRIKAARWRTKSTSV
jgi:hypothetical protein